MLSRASVNDAADPPPDHRVPSSPASSTRRSARPRGSLTARSLVAAAVIGLLAVGVNATGHTIPARAAAGATGPKVVIVVGPSSYNTRDYLDQAAVMAQQASDEGMQVTEILTPHATWDAVKQGAQDRQLARVLRPR